MVNCTYDNHLACYLEKLDKRLMKEISTSIRANWESSTPMMWRNGGPPIRSQIMDEEHPLISLCNFKINNMDSTLVLHGFNHDNIGRHIGELEVKVDVIKNLI